MSSYGQRLMRRYLEMMFDAQALEDSRPLWLEGLELDLFWPEIGFAVEFQGDQHFVPSFGLDALLTQRENDSKKRRLCEQHEIILLRLEAIDLEYTTLYHRLKAPLSGMRRLLEFIKRREIRKRLRKLNKLAIEYRATLVDGYNSPTARRKGQKRKEARKAAWSKIPVWQIIRAKQERKKNTPVAQPIPSIGAGMARAAKALPAWNRMA